MGKTPQCVLWVLLGSLLASSPVLAAPTVQVLDTWPPGDALTLPVQHRFHLRLAYDSEAPLRIWARPYFQGEEVAAASNPSPMYPAGSGEALGWFFFMEPGLEVDEVRVLAGSGGRDTPVVTVWRGQLRAGGRVGAAAAPPAWVATLKERSEALIAQADRERANQPMGLFDTLLVSGFFLLFPLVGLLALFAPFWGLWRWRGGWRLAAAVPAGVMALVVVRIVVDTVMDPTSHNLWPFEILAVGVVCLGMMGVLALMRRRGARARGGGG